MKLNGQAKVPVIAEVDLLVVGGGLSGMPAAVAYAKKGKKVLVIEQGTFLGYEIGAWQRPWLYWNPKKEKLAKEWFPLEELPAGLKEGSIVPIHMDRYKLKLEDRLMEAGVGLLYGCLPIACSRGGSGWQVIFGSRSGRLAVRAERILDTTEQSVTVNLCGKGQCIFTGTPQKVDGKEPSSKLIVHRTIEFTGVKKGVPASCTVPAELGIEGNRVDIYPGAFSENHVLVDIPSRVKRANRSNARDQEVEAALRKKSLEVAGFLANREKSFQGAKLGLGSLRVMYGESSNPLLLIESGVDLAKKLLDGTFDVGKCIVAGSEPEEGMPLTLWDAAVDQDKIGSTLEYVEKSDFNELHGYPVIEVENPDIPVLGSAQVLVVGGGTCGATAARTAAKEGVKTILVEMNTALGGTGTLGGVNEYWFGYRNGFTREIDERVDQWTDRLNFPRDFYIWALNDIWSHEIKAYALQELCTEAGVEGVFNCLVIGALMEGAKVTGAVVATPYGMGCILSEVAVDATGDGDVAAFAGAEFIYGNERDRMTMWSALAQYYAPATYGGTFTTTMYVSDVKDYTRLILTGRRIGSKPYDHASYVATRESRHIVGETVMTLSDQMRMKRYADTISLCYSNHDPKGRSTADIIYFGIIPPHLEIEVPYRALLPRKINQLLVAGKAISSTHDALAAIRMQDDFQQQGGAAGLAAALCVKNKVSPRFLNVRQLQKRLIQKGVLRDEGPSFGCFPEPDPDYDVLIDSLNGDEPNEWENMGLADKAESVSPLVHLCTAKREKVLPKLEKAFTESEGKRRLMLAKLLVWHGSPVGLDVLIEEILQALKSELPLPLRMGSLRWCHPAPDHGVMTETTYLVNVLSRAADPKVMQVFTQLEEGIRTADRDYRNPRLRIFNYIESFAYAAERLVFPDFIPLLERLLELPELQNRVRVSGIEQDFIAERQAYLVICLARALARCGSRAGLLKLVEFTADNRSLLARCACDELLMLTGLMLGNKVEEWKAALADWPERFTPMPWTMNMD